jgi:ectoine hydroxylase
LRLSPQQAAAFEAAGHLFLPQCFTSEEVDLLREEAHAIYASKRGEVWRETSSAPRTAFAAHTYSEPFRILGSHPRLIEPVEQLLGERVYVHQYKVNAKAAFDG